MVAKSCPTLCDPVECSLPGSSVHGILQARILVWVPFLSPRDLPNPGVELLLCRQILYHRATQELLCVYTYTCKQKPEHFSATTRNEILPFAATRMDLEAIMLSEQVRERQIVSTLTQMLKDTASKNTGPTDTERGWWLPGGAGVRMKAAAAGGGFPAADRGGQGVADGR